MKCNIDAFIFSQQNILEWVFDYGTSLDQWLFESNRSGSKELRKLLLALPLLLLTLLTWVFLVAFPNCPLYENTTKMYFPCIKIMFPLYFFRSQTTQWNHVSVMQRGVKKYTTESCLRIFFTPILINFNENLLF